MLFSDTITSKDTIVFINSINGGKFPSLREDTVSYFKKTYYRWNFSSSGASIEYNKYESPYWRSFIRYYLFQLKEEKIFEKDILIFHYENKLYFFEIIENRPDPYKEGDMIVLVKR